MGLRNRINRRNKTAANPARHGAYEDDEKSCSPGIPD
jgi:hypothetical protein